MNGSTQQNGHHHHDGSNLNHMHQTALGQLILNYCRKNNLVPAGHVPRAVIEMVPETALVVLHGVPMPQQNDDTARLANNRPPANPSRDDFSGEDSTSIHDIGLDRRFSNKLYNKGVKTVSALKQLSDRRIENDFSLGATGQEMVKVARDRYKTEMATTS